MPNSRSQAPSLEDLYLLTVVAETRSFTQAARRLGISKASVSVRVKDLERSAGVALVRRSTRSVALTAAAAQLVNETRASFVQIGQSFTRTRELAGVPRGLVRLSAPVALGRQHIAPSIHDFLRRYPEIRIELDLSDRLVNLVQEGFDLAVRHAHTIPGTHIARLLCESRSLLVASRHYLDRNGTPAHPSDLSRHNCLLYLRDNGAQSWSFERAGPRRAPERVSIPVTGPFRANNSEVLREAVIAGAGVGLLPDFTVHGGHSSEALVSILPDWLPVGFFASRIHLVRPWSPKAPRAIQCLIDHLRRSFQRGFAAPH